MCKYFQLQYAEHVKIPLGIMQIESCFNDLHLKNKLPYHRVMLITSPYLCLCLRKASCNVQSEEHVG